VLLADDLAVELVLPDRARERSGYPHSAGTVRLIAGKEETLTSQELPLQPAHHATGHLHVHRDVTGDEHHRAGLRSELLARLKCDDDGGRLTFTNGCFHREHPRTFLGDDFLDDGDHQLGQLEVGAE
jgi:hypothetical protein